MTYEATEQSVHDAKVVELYRYAGTYQTYRYTSGPVPVFYQASDEDEEYEYVPAATKRSAVNNVTHNDDGAEVTVELPVDNEMVIVYGFQISPPSLFCTLFRSNGPGQFIRYWHGNVENINVVKGTATVRIPSELAAALQQDFPNVFYQGPCNHTLYDARCAISFDDWSIEADIEAIDGKLITVSDVGVLAGKLVGGDAILPSGERRMIVSQAADVITVNYPFAGAEVAGTIILAAGCDLAWAGDCDIRFDNTPRFGGMPFLPNDNVFNSGLEPAKKYGGDPCVEVCEAPIFHFVFQFLGGMTGHDGDKIGEPNLGFWVQPELRSDGLQGPDEFTIYVDARWNMTEHTGSEFHGPADDYQTEQWVQVRIQGHAGSVGGAYEKIRLLVKKPGWPNYRAMLADEVSFPVGGANNFEEAPDSVTGIGGFHASGFPGTMYFLMPSDYDSAGWAVDTFDL